jgi:threonine synthase
VIKNYEYQSEFARKYYGNGLMQGRTEGRAEGRTEVQRSAILGIARARFATVAAEDEERLDAITDMNELEQLVVEVATASTYEAFQAQLSTRSKS